MEYDRPPLLVYMRQSCERCGAATEAEAAAKCQPRGDETGEAYCPVYDAELDGEGYFLGPTAASWAAYSAWLDRQIDELG